MCAFHDTRPASLAYSATPTTPVKDQSPTVVVVEMKSNNDDARRRTPRSGATTRPSMHYDGTQPAICPHSRTPTHSRILSGIQRAAQTVLGVYLKRTCSRVTSASSALGVLNDYALYKSTHSLTPGPSRNTVIADIICSLLGLGFKSQIHMVMFKG